MQTFQIYSLASPSTNNLTWFEVCQYDESLYSSSQFALETVTCLCSGWHFNVSVSDPYATLTPLSSFSGNINVIDWIPNSVNWLEIWLPYGKSMESWNLYNVSSMSSMDVSFIYESPFPPSISSNNTYLPPLVAGISLNYVSSLPDNIWSPSLSALNTIAASANSMTSISNWDYSRPLVSLQSIVIEGINVPILPDFSILTPLINTLMISGITMQAPVLSGNLTLLQTLDLNLDGFTTGITQSDFFVNLKNLNTLAISLPSSTTFCPQDCIGPPSTSYSLSLSLPQVTQFPVIFFQTGNFLSSLEYTGPVTNMALPDYAPNLQSIAFNDAQFGTTLPQQWPDLCNQLPILYSIRFSNGSVVNLPPINANCTRLGEIIVSGTSFDMNSLTNLTEIPSVQLADFSHSGLTFVNPNICSPHLVSINLAENNLETLPNCLQNNTILQQLDVTSNQLSNWHSLLNFVPNGNSFRTLSANNNNLGLGGPMPDLKSYWPQLFALSLAQNQITAHLDEPQFLNVLLSVSQIYLSNNFIYGSFNYSVFLNTTMLITLDVSYNQMNGSLPLSLFCKPISLLQLRLNNNNFSGWDGLNDPAITPCNGFLSSLNIANNSLTFYPDSLLSTIVNLMEILMDNNPMYGQPLPLLSLDNVNAGSGHFSASNCGLYDQLYSVSSYNYRVLDLSNNHLYGTIPPWIFDVSLVSDSGPVVASVNLDNNDLHGDIPIPTVQANSNSPTYYSFSASSNQLNGTIPVGINGYIFIKFDVSNNPLLSGVMPFFSNTFFLHFINPISYEIDVSGCPLIDMCSNSYQENMAFTTARGIPSSSSLNNSSACKCPNIYPDTSIANCPTTPSPITCIGLPPSNDFLCVDGFWTLPGSVSSPNQPIPITGPTIIGGNVQSGSGLQVSIPFQTSNSGGGGNIGFGSSGTDPLLTVQGCLDVPSISITLSSNDVETINNQNGHSATVNLVQQASNCSNSLQNLQIKLNQAKSCKSASTTLSSSSNINHLIAIFSINSTKCNVWWIVLICVLGSIIIFAAIAVTVYVIWRRRKFHGH